MYQKAHSLLDAIITILVCGIVIAVTIILMSKMNGW